MRRTIILAALALTGAACSPGDAAQAPTPGVVVDSAIPIPDAIRRFQWGDEPVAAMSGGAGSVEELLERLVAAYAGRDSAALAALAMTRAEFGYLYYPESPYPLPPYELAPDLLWYLLEQDGATGVARGIDRLARRELRVVGHRCAEAVREEGRTRLRGPCSATVRHPDGTEEELSIANAIAERDGRFKLVSLQNEL